MHHSLHHTFKEDVMRACFGRACFHKHMKIIDFIDFFHIFPFNASHFLFYRITSKSCMFFCPSQYFLVNFGLAGR